MEKIIQAVKDRLMKDYGYVPSDDYFSNKRRIVFWGWSRNGDTITAAVNCSRAHDGVAVILVYDNGNDFMSMAMDLESCCQTIGSFQPDAYEKVAKRIKKYDHAPYEEMFLNEMRNGNSIAIYQLKDEYRQRCAIIYDEVMRQNGKIDRAYYHCVYCFKAHIGVCPVSQANLNRIYMKFTYNLPEGFSGGSTTVGDVYVIQHDGVMHSYFVNDIGFIPVDTFMRCL